MRSIELSTYVLNVHLCKKMNSLVDSEMKVYYVSEVLKQGANIKTMYPNYIFEFKKHELEFITSLSRHVDQDRNCHRKIESVKLLVIAIIVIKRYPSTWCV